MGKWSQWNQSIRDNTPGYQRFAGNAPFIGPQQSTRNLMGQMGSQVKSGLKNAWSRSPGPHLFSGKHHKVGMNMAKDMLGFGLFKKGAGILERAGGLIGAGFMVGAMYEGYKESGITGAAKAGVEQVGINYLLGRGLSTVFKGMLPLGLKAGLVGAAAIGVGAGLANTSVANFLSPLARGAVREHGIKHAKLELGTPTIDPFGMVSTMRQRSLMSIQNSRVNGRTALGNEASLLYRPYSL
jgi:hypothetical protein